MQACEVCGSTWEDGEEQPCDHVLFAPIEVVLMCALVALGLLVLLLS
jgi:hypothetical protein